jgi:hypothetical protein
VAINKVVTPSSVTLSIRKRCFSTPPIQKNAPMPEITAASV